MDKEAALMAYSLLFRNKMKKIIKTLRISNSFLIL